MGHRIMHEHVMCHSVHGHRVKIEMTFRFKQTQEIGYCIDFKEIRRIGGQWLEDTMDHGFVANPHDEVMINTCQQLESKLYLMSLNGEKEYCNPTAENIAKEIFMAMEILFASFSGLEIYHVRYTETPNCWVDTYKGSVHKTERENFYLLREQDIAAYAKDKGVIEYDSRKL